MIKIATPHFDFESKNDYQKPTMKMVQLHHHAQILAESTPKMLSGEKGEDSKPDTWYELE